MEIQVFEAVLQGGRGQVFFIFGEDMEKKGRGCVWQGAGGFDVAQAGAVLAQIDAIFVFGQQLTGSDGLMFGAVELAQGAGAAAVG